MGHNFLHFSNEYYRISYTNSTLSGTFQSSEGLLTLTAGPFNLTQMTGSTNGSVYIVLTGATGGQTSTQSVGDINVCNPVPLVMAPIDCTNAITIGQSTCQPGFPITQSITVNATGKNCNHRFI